MTNAARPSHEDAMAISAEHMELQRWRAAQTVRAQLSAGPDRDDVLDCLGLTDAARPWGL